MSSSAQPSDLAFSNSIRNSNCSSGLSSKIVRKHQQDFDLSSGSFPFTHDIHSDKRSLADQMNIGPYDVLCGRHRLAFNNIGNRRFRVTVSLFLDRYMEAPTRQEKSLIVLSVAGIVKSTVGRFMKWNSAKTEWVELNDKKTREKVGHALRDMALAKEAGYRPGKSICRRMNKNESLYSANHLIQ